MTSAGWTETIGAAGAPVAFERILITGANGFVGRHLVPALAARLAPGARLMLAARNPADGASYEQVDFDLAKPCSIAVAIEQTRPDLVIHLAAQASVGQAAESAGETWAINLCGSLALARAIAALTPACTLFQISSAEVYGQTFNQEVANEGSALRPLSAYARSKAAAEAMFTDVLPKTARLIVARPSNHSGSGQDERFVIPAFAAQIARVERGDADRINVGNLDARRDFLDVRDVVQAYLALLFAAPTLPMRNVFNIASSQTMRIGEILDRLRALSPAQIEVSPDPLRLRPSEVGSASIDTGALRAVTGWAPAYGLNATLAEVMAEQRVRIASVS